MPYKDPEKKKEKDREHSKRKYRQFPEYFKEYQAKNRDRISARQKEYYRTVDKPRRQKRQAEIKQKVFEHYGGVCACCGESHIEFLTIDHVDGGGCQHRRAIKRSGGTRFYEWLIKNDYPDGFRVLCMNCNWATRFGVCPHKREING